MTTYTLTEAKAEFSRVVEEAEAGNTALITKHGRPAVMIVRHDEAVEHPKRGLVGCLKEDFAGWQIPEDFDKMMQDEIVTLFEGGLI